MIIDDTENWTENGLKCPYCERELDEYKTDEYLRYVCEFDESGEFEDDEFECPECGKHFKMSGELEYEPLYRIYEIKKRKEDEKNKE